MYCNSKQPAEHKGSAPYWGRRKDAQAGPEVEPDGVRLELDNGMRLKNQLRATRPSHAVTYASCQGLTLHNLALRHLCYAGGFLLRGHGGLRSG